MWYASICIHKKHREYCIECNDVGICIHKKSRWSCPHVVLNGIKKNIYFALLVNIFVELKDMYQKKINMSGRALIVSIIIILTKKVPSRYKRKQHYIHDKLVETYGSNFEYDRTISCSSSGKIPDWFYDSFTHVLNIECDEEQHKSRDTSCENKRLMLLFKDCGNRPFVCLRFNPDKYVNENGKKIKGCFSFDEVNNLIVDEKEFNKRWNILQIEIDYYLKNIPTKEVTVKKLFYDNK